MTIERVVDLVYEGAGALMLDRDLIAETGLELHGVDLDYAAK